MRVEVVAIGTELLLGQIADTNSQWLGEQLAALGVTSQFHQHVGDNHERIVATLRIALSRSDAVIICGGLGPTQDDITRAAVAEIMGVPLVRDPELVAVIESLFSSRGRTMPENNRLQADVPVGATVITQVRGTAPGLICPVGDQVMYALPGVPYEMTEMFERAVGPDLVRRSAAAGESAAIASRVLRTWGASESALAEALAERVRELEGDPHTTLAFLASGVEGIKTRLTVRAADAATVQEILGREESRVREIITARLGDVIFGADEVTMERAIGELLLARGLTLAVAESVTGGLIASRIVNVEGASRWFRGGVVSYASDVKYDLLGVRPGPVVSDGAALDMAAGVRRALGSDVGLSVTGVAGPEEQDGQPVGTVFVGLVWPEGEHVEKLQLPGDRPRVRNYATISALDVLRRQLIKNPVI